MKTYPLDLLFEGDPKAELPGPARAFVVVKHWSESENPKDVLVITPDCVTEKELEHQIARLHKELDIILAEARRKFAAYDKAQQQHFATQKPSTHF